MQPIDNPRQVVWAYNEHKLALRRIAVKIAIRDNCPLTRAVWAEAEAANGLGYPDKRLSK